MTSDHRRNTNSNGNHSDTDLLVLEKPSSSSHQQRRTDGGNVQLMEARLTELYSSLRALTRSNQDLKDALTEYPEDADFRKALEENYEVMKKQRILAMELVMEMKLQGYNIDLPDDICNMVVEEEEHSPTETTDQQEQHQAHQSAEDNNNDNTIGIYL